MLEKVSKNIVFNMSISMGRIVSPSGKVDVCENIIQDVESYNQMVLFMQKIHEKTVQAKSPVELTLILHPLQLSLGIILGYTQSFLLVYQKVEKSKYLETRVKGEFWGQFYSPPLGYIDNYSEKEVILCNRDGDLSPVDKLITRCVDEVFDDVRSIIFNGHVSKDFYIKLGESGEWQKTFNPDLVRSDSLNYALVENSSVVDVDIDERVERFLDWLTSNYSLDNVELSYDEYLGQIYYAGGSSKCEDISDIDISRFGPPF